MAKNIGKNTNTTDLSTMPSPISIGSSVSVMLLPAQAPTDQAWIEVNVTPTGTKALWIKLQAASVDNDKKGIRVAAGETKTVVKDGSYTGEICAIYDSGPAKDVVLEYR